MIYCKHKPKITWRHILLKSNFDDFYECKNCGAKIRNKSSKKSFENSAYWAFITFFATAELLSPVYNNILSWIKCYINNVFLSKLLNIIGIIIWNICVVLPIVLAIYYKDRAKTGDGSVS